MHFWGGGVVIIIFILCVEGLTTSGWLRIFRCDTLNLLVVDAICRPIRFTLCCSCCSASAFLSLPPPPPCASARHVPAVGPPIALRDSMEQRQEYIQFLKELEESGVADDNFEQLLSLEDKENPHFVVDVVGMFVEK